MRPVNDITPSPSRDVNARLARLEAIVKEIMSASNVLDPSLGTAALKDTGTSGSTVPLLDGANTWSGANIFSEEIRTGSVTLEDDTATSFTPPVASGILIIQASGALGGLFVYATSVTNLTLIARSAATLATVATTLAGTTGVDGNFTIGNPGTGLLYLENRLGSTTAVTYLIIR
jgi:hypothetical protein